MEIKAERSRHSVYEQTEIESERDLIGFRGKGEVGAAAVAASAASSMKQWLVSIKRCECYICVERLGFCFNLNWLQLDDGPFRVVFKH